MSKILCDPYLWESPRVLAYTSFWGPAKDACVSEVINHIVLVAAVLGIAGFGVGRATGSAIPVAVAVIAFLLLVAPSLRLALGKSRMYESFQDGVMPGGAASKDVVAVGSSPAATRVFRQGPTMPTARNPFMNILVDEYKYNPKRPTAASVVNPDIKVTLDDFYRTEFTSDPTDVFGRTQSQRQFITMPVTSIPNDVDSYQNWLYRIPGQTCKEGGREACLPGTDTGHIPWLTADS